MSSDIQSMLNGIFNKQGVKIENFTDVEFYSRDHCLDLGNKALNYLCSGSCNKGLLTGQMVSLEGASYTGKTLTASHCIAAGVKAGALTLVADIERSQSVENLASFGIDPNKVYSMEGCQQLETFFMTAYNTILEVPKKYPNTPLLIVVDSLSALVTRHLQDVGLDKVDLQKAKQISSGLNLIQSALSQAPNCYFVMVNQVYDTMETNQYATEEQKHKVRGGKAIEYYPGTRLRFTTAKKVLKDEKDKKSQAVGSWIRVESIKNRFNNPYCKAELLTIYGKGYDEYSGLFTLAFNHGLIEQVKSGWYNFKEDPIPSNFRKAAFEDMCRENPEYLDRIDTLSIKYKPEITEEMKAIPDSFEEDDEVKAMTESMKQQASENLQQSGALNFSV